MVHVSCGFCCCLHLISRRGGNKLRRSFRISGALPRLASRYCEFRRRIYYLTFFAVSALRFERHSCKGIGKFGNYLGRLDHVAVPSASQPSARGCVFLVNSDIHMGPSILPLNWIINLPIFTWLLLGVLTIGQCIQMAANCWKRGFACDHNNSEQ